MSLNPPFAIDDRPWFNMTVHGAGTWFPNQHGWDQQIIGIIRRRYREHAENVEHKSPLLLPGYGKWKIVQTGRNIADRLNELEPSEARIRYWGHSRAAEALAWALPHLKPGLRIHEAHLIAPACDHRFGPRGNGFNAAFMQDKIRRLVIYRAESDWAMTAAKASWMTLGWVKLSFGALGAWECEDVHPAFCGRVIEVDGFGAGHCSMLDGKEVLETTAAFVPTVVPGYDAGYLPRRFRYAEAV